MKRQCPKCETFLQKLLECPSKINYYCPKCEAQLFFHKDTELMGVQHVQDREAV